MLRKFLWLASFFLLMTNINAANLATAISCPSVSEIQQAAGKIDQVEFQDGLYNVSTSEAILFRDTISWYVGKRGIHAKSSDDAVAIANNLISHISKIKYAQPLIITVLAFCFYDPGDIVAVGIPILEKNKFQALNALR